MFNKKLCVALVAFLLLHDVVQGKKTRKTKRRKPEEEDYTPQPSVVSYSTFGFNDVGTYEGFVPSSPDYAKLLSATQDSTKQHSSGFPTSPESNDYSNSFSSQPYSAQSFSMSEDNGSQSSFVQYPQSVPNLFQTPSFDSNADQHRNIATEEIYGRNTEEVNAPTYGTKLNSKKETRPFHQYNNTDFTGPSGSTNEEKFTSFNEAKPTFENRPYQEIKPSFETRPPYSESGNSFYNPPSYPSAAIDDFNSPVSSDTLNQLKFPRVVDFTKLKQNHYPAELDTSRLPSPTPIPDVYENNESVLNKFMHTYSNSNKHFLNPTTKHKDTFDQNNNEDSFATNPFKTNNVKEDSYTYSGYTSGKDNLLISNSDAEHKKKSIQKPWSSAINNFKNWKEPSPSKGYEYSTNYSSMSFKYDADQQKMTKPLGSLVDELIPASSNLDVPNYQYPEADFSHFKKMPEYKVHEEDEFANFPSFKESKPDFDYNQYKYLYSTTPATTSNWGNAFKSSEHSSSVRSHPSANKYKYRDYDEVVNIPRRPNKLNYDKPIESKPHEWTSQYNRRPYKSKPYKDWSNEISTTRFKSEEDLLGLRNKDTSHPSYLPSYQSNFDSEETDFKNVVDKWRQSYLKSKYKDSLRDYESYGTETKPLHVPVPKPFPLHLGDRRASTRMAFPEEPSQPIMNLQIEVPHPIVVPVPQPYPVRVPIAKPVAVPLYREIKIPIEKPMPYLVYKDVPYPVEKLVPVHVEKEVPVPVVKPYPVHIPYIRPVFHHTKPRDEYESDHRDDDDYLPRPEGKHKYSNYKKKVPNSSRNRSRRPSRAGYQDRTRRRWPDRQHPMDRKDHRRPIELQHPSPFKRRDSETTRHEDETNMNFHL